MLLTALLAMSAAQPYAVEATPPAVRDPSVFTVPRPRKFRSDGRANRLSVSSASGATYQFFEFAPADGAGMSVACACTAVTGAKGETITYTRTGSGTCLKGPQYSGIANGDLVTCSSDRPRVMPGGDGTGGVGLMIEEARTNQLLHSAGIDNVAWSDQTAVVAAPTLNKTNAAVAPDGTTTAEDYTFPATGASERSGRFQAAAGISGVTANGTVFIKGVSGSGSLDVCVGTAASASCSTCSYSSSTWSRCGAVNNIASQGLFIGNNTLRNGGTTRASNRVYVWGAQGEAGVGVTSYIATTTGAATRNADLAYSALSSITAMNSIAYTYVTPSAYISTPVPVTWRKDASNMFDGWINSTPAFAARLLVGGAGKGPTSTASVPVLTSNRLSWNGNGTTTSTCVNSVCDASTPASWTPPSGTTTVYIGTYNTGAYSANGVIKRVCLSMTNGACL